VTARVVLVPGLGLGPESYAPTLAHLRVPAEIVTLPGYGTKAYRTDNLQTEALAARLANHLTEPVVLVGHSASCQIVVATAVAHPELVKALVLVAPSGEIGTSTWLKLAARWVRSAVWDPPRLVPTLAPQYFRTGFASMARAMEAARHYDLAEAVPGVKAPTILVRSKHDHLAPAYWTERLAELTGGETWTLSKGSHMPVLTNGPEVAAFIQRAAGVYNEQ
jgi:pimeloyl-ACP methyl ester carboxylesterase